LNTFVYGLSAGNLGEEPETAGGTASQIMGEIVSLVGITLLTEGLGTAALGAGVARAGASGTRLGRIFASAGAREGAITGGRAAFSTAGKIGLDATAGIVADEVYQAATPWEEPSYMHFVYPVLNVAFPLLGHQVMKRYAQRGLQVIGEDGETVVERTIHSTGASEAEELSERGFSEAFNARYADPEEAAQFVQANFPSVDEVFTARSKGFQIPEELKSLPKEELALIRSDLEADITMYGRQAEIYQLRQAELKTEIDKTRLEWLYGKKGESFHYDKGRALVDKEFNKFFKEIGNQISEAEQRVLFKEMERVQGVFKNIDVDNIERVLARKRGAPRLTSEPNARFTPKEYKARIRTLVDKIQRTELNVKYGLEPDAPASKLIKRMDEHEALLRKLEQDRVDDIVTKNIMKDTDTILDNIISNPYGALSPEFRESAGFLRFSRAVGFFKSQKDPLFRAAEADETLNLYLAQEKKFAKQIIEADRKATKIYKTEKDLSEKLESEIYRGKEIDPKEFAELRPHLINIIKKELKRVSIEFINEDLAKQMKVAIAKQANIDSKAVQGSVMQEINSIQEQVAQTFLSKPEIARAIADATGNKNLRSAVDLLFASLGDPTAQARILGMELMEQGRIAKEIVHNRLIARPLPSLEDSVQDLLDSAARTKEVTKDITKKTKKKKGKGKDKGDKGSGTGRKKLETHPGEPPEVAPNGAEIADDALGDSPDELIQRMAETTDLGTMERWFRTPRQLAEKYYNNAKNPILKGLYKRAVDFIDNAYERRILNLQGIQEELEPRIVELRNFVKTNGKDGESLVRFLEDTSREATEMLEKNPKDYDAVFAYIRGKVDKQSETVKKGYAMYEDLRQLIRSKANEGIDRYNARIAAGEIPGKVNKKTGKVDPLPHIKDRPGWIPFIYEGDYAIKWINAEGKKQSLGFVMGRDQAVQYLKSLFGGEVKVGKGLQSFANKLQEQSLEGRIILEPRFLEDVEALMDLGALGRNLDDAFGIEANELGKLIREGKFSSDNIHDVFYGSARKRILNIESQKMGLFAGLEISGRQSFRFGSYIDFAAEGQQLARSLNHHGLGRWGDYIKTYSDDIMGRTRNVEEIVDFHINGLVESMHKVPGLSAALRQMGIVPNGRIMRAVVNGLTFLGRLSALGFNVSTAFINGFIIPTNVAPVIGLRNAFKAMGSAHKMLNPTGELKAFLQKGGVTIRHSGIGMRDVASKSDLLLTHGQAVLNKLDNYSMYLFNKSEDIARGVTLIGAKDHATQMAKTLAKGASPKTWQEKLLKETAEQLGKNIDDVDVLEAYAVRIMKDTNFDFDVTGLSEIARNPLLKPFAQFKTYFQKEIEFLLGKAVPLSKKEQMMALGMFGIFGGALAIPGVEEVDNISRFAGLGSPKLYMQTVLPELMAIGLPSMIGLDFSNKLNIGSVTYAFNPDNIAGIGVAKGLRTIRGIRDGNLGAIDATLGNISSFKHLYDGMELMTTGRNLDKYGNLEMRRDQLNGLQLTARTLGFGDPLTNELRAWSRHIKSEKDSLAASNAKAMTRILDLEESGRFKEAGVMQAEYDISNSQLNSARKDRDRLQIDRVYDSMGRQQVETKNKFNKFFGRI